MRVNRFATALAAFALAPTLAVSHPLDGLTGAEMERVTEILREAGEANDQTRPRSTQRGRGPSRARHR